MFSINLIFCFELFATILPTLELFLDLFLDQNPKNYYSHLSSIVIVKYFDHAVLRNDTYIETSSIGVCLAKLRFST